MRNWFALGLFSAFVACGSDDGGGGTGGKSGSGGGGGNQGTTCADGYPKVDSPCAILFEQCKSCGTGSWECCDVFECQADKTWKQTQVHTACPADAGADSATD